MKIQESAENYLETILVLKERKGLVRSIDIANELEFSKPSVSIAMRNLRENGYVSMDAGGFITLLPAGQEIAERIYERHRLLTKWLTGLGVDPAIASEDACRIEHVISAESFAAIKAHVQKHDAEYFGNTKNRDRRLSPVPVFADRPTGPAGGGGDFKEPRRVRRPQAAKKVGSS